MELVLRRVALKDTYTIGKLYIDGKYFCDTLEDKVRDLNKNGVFDGDEKKVYGETAIPYGTYKVSMDIVSPKYGKVMPRIMNVPHFEGILIHNGSDASNTLGCVLVGKNKVRGRVVESRKTFKELYSILENAEDEITIDII